MNRMTAPVTLTAAFILGCVTSSAVVSTSHAESDSVECREWLLRAGRAATFAHAEETIGDDAVARVTIPRGWNAIGAAGGDGRTSVVACRTH
ncbi:MAG: hypothetical protein KUG77_06380 [Nannocystaceae bacterium]|nr:hypothetical protein [Nannocystaceae bacterium]